MSDREDLYWLAGLLEGEGCFNCQARPTSSTMYYRVALQMVDLDVVEKVGRICKGIVGQEYSIGYNKHLTARKLNGDKKQPTYSLYITGKNARRLMKMLLPLMGERRQEEIRRAMAGIQPPKGRIDIEKLFPGIKLS